jgi:hypothetical protein
MVAANRQIFEQARAVSGYFYPVDSVPMSLEDWRRGGRELAKESDAGR